jgi:hypothetical protein
MALCGLSQEQGTTLEQWIQQQRDDKNAPPVTLDGIKAHTFEPFGMTIAKKHMGPLMKALGWSYIDPGSGYLEKHANLPSTLAHMRSCGHLWSSSSPTMLSYYNKSKPVPCSRVDQG